MLTTTTTYLETLRARVGVELEARMPAHLERLQWPADRLASHQRDRLRALLRHAIERSPFHARRLGPIADPDHFELSDLATLPTMSKPEMVTAFDDVVTDRRLSLASIGQHIAASSNQPKLLLDEYVCLASGGSSGLRGIFVQRLGEFADLAASVMRPAIARQVAAGSSGEGVVIGAVLAASPVHASGFATATASGPVRFVSVPATLAIAEAVERLNTLQPVALMGYPTKLTQLAREQMLGRLTIAPRSVTSTSEQLTADDRTIITTAFGVPVIDMFASTEGLVGHSDPGGSVLTFATDMCIVELVDAENRPLADGTASTRVLVTNLYNLTQPLIRYELTDRFVRYPTRPGSGHLRAEVDGRADDVFRFDGVEVHPLVIATAMVKTPRVLEYQVRQTARGVDVAVVTEGPIEMVRLAEAIEDGLRRAGLTGPLATVREVASIPRHPQTGKTRRFIPLEP
jgi:phenylacetate-coenzyme A ligase PaaK-like adenylate-forming protein